MCILSDTTLHERLYQFFADAEGQREFVNPASVDIRIGQHLEYEDGVVWDLIKQGPYTMAPKEFVLASTYEHIMVPIDCVVELKLKSTLARKGFDHSLAFHVDPGWDGILTMEIHNMNRLRPLTLEYGQRFAQIIVYKLDKPAANPYSGRYQNATSVETAK